MSHEIKAILFDADGMLIHANRFSQRLSDEYGINLETTLPFFKNEFQDCLIGKKDLREELSKKIEGWGWNGSLDEILKFWFEGERNIDTEITKAINTLNHQGIQCFLCTNQELHRTNFMRKTMGFDSLFKHIYSSAEIGFKKPEPEFFEFVLDKLNSLNKNNVLFWDDDEENVNGAKEFGFNAELYENIGGFISKLKDYNINV